jgi:hypothetical protein
MKQDFFRCSALLTRTTAALILEKRPDWILIDDKRRETKILIPGVDLARNIEESDDAELDLMKIPAQRYELAGISILASLQEALVKLQETGAEALYVERRDRGGKLSIQGILTREQIESAYRP